MMWAQVQGAGALHPLEDVELERLQQRMVNRDAAFIAMQNGIEARELVEVEEAQAANEAHMRRHYSHVSLARKPKSFGLRTALQGAANFEERSLLTQPSSAAQTANQRERGGGQEHESSDGSEEEEKEGKEKEGATATKAYLLPPRSLQPSARSVRISSSNGPGVGACRTSNQRATFAGPNESTSSDEAQASDTSPSSTALRKSGTGWFQVGFALPKGSEDEAEDEDEEEIAEACRLVRVRSQAAEAARARLRRMSVSSQLSAAVNSTKPVGGQSKSRRESSLVSEAPYQHKLLSRLEQRFSSSGYLPSTSSPLPSTSSLQGSTSGPKQQRNSQLSPLNGTLRGIAAPGVPTLSRSSGQLPSHTSLLAGGPAAAEKGAQAGGLSRRARQTSTSGVMVAAAADSGGRLREQDRLPARLSLPDSPPSACTTPDTRSDVCASASPLAAAGVQPGGEGGVMEAWACTAGGDAAPAAAGGVPCVVCTSTPTATAGGAAGGGGTPDVATAARPCRRPLEVGLCSEQRAEEASSASSSASPLGRPFSPSPPSAQGEPGMPRGRGASLQLSSRSTSGPLSARMSREGMSGQYSASGIGFPMGDGSQAAGWGRAGHGGSVGGSSSLSERLPVLEAGSVGGLLEEAGGNGWGEEGNRHTGSATNCNVGGPPSVDGGVGASDEGLGAGDAAGDGGNAGNSDGDMYDGGSEATAPAPGSGSSQIAGTNRSELKLLQGSEDSTCICTRGSSSSSSGCNPQLGVLSGVEGAGFGKQLGLKAPTLSVPMPVPDFAIIAEANTTTNLLETRISDMSVGRTAVASGSKEAQRPCLAPARPVSALKPRSWSQAPYTGSVFAAGAPKHMRGVSLDLPTRSNSSTGHTSLPLPTSIAAQVTHMQPHPPPASPRGKGGPIRIQSSLGQKPKPKTVDEGAPVVITNRTKSAHQGPAFTGKSFESPTLSSLNAATVRQQQASIPPKPRSLSSSKARPLPPKTAPSASSSGGPATVLVVAPEAAQSAGSNPSAAAVPKRPQSSSSSGGSSKPCVGLQARTASTTRVQAAGSQGGAAAVGAAAKRGGKPTLKKKAALGEAMASVLNPARPLQRT